MFSYFRKGRSESKTFIEDKVKWFHFMEGFKDIVYEHVLYNIFKKYPDYRIEQGEYTESIEYKKGKLFEILIILYITEGHKAINSFPDFIEKWFRDGILILITDQGDELINEMKNQFFDKKSEFSYIYKTKLCRFIFEIERETGKINLLIFPSYCEYFSRFDSLQYSYDSKPIAKCLWTSKTKDGIEATFVPTPLSKEEHKRAHSKDNKDWSIVGTRLFDQGIKIKLNLDELCKYEEERNTKRLIRKVTGMSNKKYKEFLNDVKRRVYRYDLQSEILVAKIAKATDFPVNNYTVAIAMRWLNIGRGWNVSHIKVTDLLDAIIEIKEENDA